MSPFSSLFTGGSETAPPEHPAGTYRILLVDDEPNVLKALQRAFRQEGYQIETATNGREALDLLNQRPFHLVISDYLMPTMDGAELLKEARKLYPDTVRILLTGQATTGAVIAAIKEGAVYKFILKPWNEDDLRVTVALALQQYELRQRNQQLQQEVNQKTKEIAAFARVTVSHRSQLAVMLHKHRLLTSQQVQELQRLQQKRKEPVAVLLMEKGWVSEAALHALLRKELQLEPVDLAAYAVEPLVTQLIPKSFCERQCVMPLKLDGRRLVLALPDPLDVGLLDDMRFVSGLDIVPVLAGVEAIRTKIQASYHGGQEVHFEDLETVVGGADPYEGIEIVIDDDEAAPLDDLLHATEEPPAIRVVNAIILEAIRLGASDIHIQPRSKNVVVRYRIDGVLADNFHIPHPLHQSLVARLKIMAELDISERRRPQDGRITVKTPSRMVDLRISTLPTINGEKVVMRILDRNNAIVDLRQLGFSEPDYYKIINLVDKPQGIILTTGPTGSGKTTTLYSLLQASATPEKNYVTIEDPVEYYMDMAGQVLIKERIGLSFPVVLRSILRQDPDVIMLGEIRDFETAEVAFHAALTGHLVYSTLHTNSAIATVSRLFDLGLKPFIIATALEGIIAQRLVRRICPHCKQPVPAPAGQLSRLGQVFTATPPPTYKGAGCAQCHNSGYKGRVGLYELLVPDEELRHMIASGSNTMEIAQHARRLENASMLEDGYAKVAAGQTTVDEVLRVLGPQNV